MMMSDDAAGDENTRSFRKADHGWDGEMELHLKCEKMQFFCESNIEDELEINMFCASLHWFQFGL